jgi:hypothetical protein
MQRIALFFCYAAAQAEGGKTKATYRYEAAFG